jgi:hypothetical protein
MGNLDEDLATLMAIGRDDLADQMLLQRIDFIRNI